ncbi:hypothetical protein ACHJH3_06845 [Campylobacter sp. MOP7]|uniref:hypothetical protein n=1 Tax=Campylobacter canis TaxID=3378588 RepID=UPI00387ED332
MKLLTLRDVNKITNIPYKTLSQWQNTKDESDYRRKLVAFLRSSTKNRLQEVFGVSLSENEFVEVEAK